MSEPFFVKDCTHAVLATGKSACSLVEFKEALFKVPESSLYFHFWGSDLRVSLFYPELHNDFARWAYYSLHDRILSERLAIIDPTDYNTLEDLREILITLLEERIDEVPHIGWSKENAFHFLSSMILVYDIPYVINSPSELKNVLPKLPLTSYYYHFIDSRRRNKSQRNDFSEWLQQFNSKYEKLISEIDQLDPYFLSLGELKKKLIQITLNHFP